MAGITLTGCVPGRKIEPDSIPHALPLRFEIVERFGVSHPDQIIDFDLPPSTPTQNAAVVNDAGEPVPFQFLDNGKKLAVRTDLPAGTTKSWTLIHPSTPGEMLPANPDTVTVHETDTHYEIANNRTAVRVPKYSPTESFLRLLAPVQGIRLADGAWTATGPNELSVWGEWREGSTRLLERGPLMVVAEVHHQFDRPEYRYGTQTLAPEGPGFYRCTITLQAGQPSILFEEETDMDVYWSLNFYEPLRPTHGRYRGHHARSQKAGYEPDGQVYRMTHSRPPMDAQVDLDYPQTPAGAKPEANWRRMALWDPWCFDTGWYWQLFNRDAGESAPHIGIFAGHASRLLGAHMSGPGVFHRGGSPPAAGIASASFRRGPDARVFHRSRFEWGLFVSTKADLREQTELQPINRQMNIHGGINLNKVHRWSMDFPDPSGGYGGAFMHADAMAAVRERVRSDPAYYGWLYNADPYTRPLFDAWLDPTGKRDAAVTQVVAAARNILENLVNRGGIYEFGSHYWHGGLTAQRYGVWIDQLLAEPDLPNDQRAALKAAAVLFANLVWDDDHAPVGFTEHGLNLGTENMPLQQWGYRRFYALFMGRHPTMRERVPQVVQGLRAAVEQQINEYGAHIGCPHYVGASFLPTLNNLMQVKQLGELDPFVEWPKLAKFAEFFLNLLTPPEPRVGGKRCFIALGDSGTEPSEIYGVLGTGFRDANPSLSARLMGAWHAGGRPHSSFFGSTLLMIDDRLPATDPQLGDATFQGYYTVLRHGWGTSHETALWIVNGDHYRDHRHHDHGMFVLYALGRPISVSWSAIYTPYTPSPYLHSTVVPEAALDHPWDQNGVPLSGSRVWARSSQTNFLSTANRAGVVSVFERDGLTWKRRAIVDRSNSARPIIVIRDTFDGPDAAFPKIASWFLMATGAVNTAHGPITPPEHRHPTVEYRQGAPPTDLPSATPPFDLAPGMHRFDFHGRYDVDVEVYVHVEKPAQALLGNWAVSAWGSHVTESEERQHILRIRSAGAFTTILLPHRKNEPDRYDHITAENGALRITDGSREVSFALEEP